jgi:hypothetical protein
VHLLAAGDADLPETVPRDHLYRLSWNPGTLMGSVAALPGVARATRVGVDGLTPLFEQLTAAFLAHADVVDGEALLRDVRRVKTTDEIARIRAAIAVAERVMEHARAATRAGAAEREIVAIAMEAMARAGVTTAAAEPVVTRNDGGTGIDIAVLRDGWEGGLARIEPTGAPSADHVAAIARCTPGTRVEEVAPPDGAVRGAGLGYEVLEPERALEPSMVLSVATGPVRDLVLVTDGAPEVLTTAAY